MVNFIIKAIEENFNHLFAMSESELKNYGAVKMVVDQYPGFPCRVSLEDAQIGEEVILLSYKHHQTNSPYQASGPIFIRKNIRKAEPKENEIPRFLLHRYLSLRGYDESGMMQASATCNGEELKQKLEVLFLKSEISYVHIHNAKPGCYNCVAVRI